MQKVLGIVFLFMAGCAGTSPESNSKGLSTDRLELGEALILGSDATVRILRGQTQAEPFADHLPSDLTSGRASQSSAERSERQKFIRQFRSWKLGKKTSRGQQIIAEFQCSKATEAQALGLSLELDFPQTEAQLISELLHEKVLSCGGSLVTDSLFKLSVFAIQKGQCPKAESYLNAVTSEGEAGIVDRVSFLRSLCSKEKNFVSRNPWGGYGVLVNKTKNILEGVSHQPAWYLSATSGVSDWDRLLVSMLDLSQQGKSDKIRSLATKINYDKFRQLPASFQASVLVILSFHGADLQVFQTLNRYLVEHPTMYNHSLLGLLFPVRYWKEIVENSKMEDPILVKALIRQESAFNPQVRSRAKAAGLMQLIYPTAHSFGLRQPADLYKPAMNIEAGSKFLSYLVKEFGSVELALAAYNAGPEMVRQWKKRYPTDNVDLFVEMIPYAETREYVRLVTRNYKVYQNILVPPQIVTDRR